MATKKDDYSAKMTQQLDEMNGNIDALAARAHTAQENVREQYRVELAKVRQQSNLAVAKLVELKAASEASWDKMVAEMDKASNAFIHSFEAFKTKV